MLQGKEEDLQCSSELQAGHLAKTDVGEGMHYRRKKGW